MSIPAIFSPRTQDETTGYSLFTGSRLTSLLLISIFVVVIGHLLTLTLYPRVFVDEGWLANASWTWLTTGVNFDSMYTGVLDQFGYGWVARFFIGQAPYVLSFGTLGLGLFQARFVSWVFGVILLVIVIFLGRRCYSLQTGLLAALLLALSLPFLQASRWRQDIFLTAVIMLSLWLALYALEENKLWAHFASGLLLGISPDIHQSVTIIYPALAALYVAYYGRVFLMRRGTWVVGAGAALGLLIYAVIHILPSPNAYSALMSFNVGSGAEGDLPIIQPSTLPASFIGEMGRYGFRYNLLDFVLIVLAGLLLLYRRSKYDRLILVFTIVAFLDSVLFSGKKTDLYSIHLYPLFMLIVAELFIYVSRMAKKTALKRLATIILVLFIGHGVFQVTSRIYANRDYDYYAITNPMREVIPSGSRVMGMPEWWFGFHDYDYRSSLSLTYYEFYNDYSVTEAFQQIQPDYMIVDSTQQILLVDEGEELAPGLNAFKLSREEFTNVLATHAEQILEFTDPWHGTFQVYKMNWDDA